MKRNEENVYVKYLEIKRKRICLMYFLELIYFYVIDTVCTCSFSFVLCL